MMRNAKSLAALLIALSLVFMTVGCGSNSTDDSAASGGNAETELQNDEPTEYDDSEDTDTQADSQDDGTSDYASETVAIEKVDGLSDDFMMGMDISSIVSEFESGVTYKDFDGNTIDNLTDFCAFLAEDCGITDVRVRIWNDPYDEDGNCYGGGNCDVDHAVTVAEACAAAGIRLFADFHYSDFWADPSRQLVPKAWSDYTLEEKEEALAEFTTEALDTIANTGVTISMVQVGNETTAGLVGEDSVENICALLNAGSAAVRAFDSDIRVVINVTNPEEQNMTLWAGYLEDYSVDYDILATSYYPFWHADMENLADQLTQVQEQYGKEVFVAETYYAYTLEDSDGNAGQVIAEGNNDDWESYGYEFSVDGQAQYLRDLIETISNAGGTGLFYWEPAWITVGDTTGLTGTALEEQMAENEALWNTYGSGWATAAASIYDPEYVGDDYGGTGVENVALFAPDGSALASLRVFTAARTGWQEDESGDDTDETSDSGTAVDADDGNSEEDAGSGGSSDENLIPESARGFESASPYTIDGDGITIPSEEDVLDGSYSMHWYDEVDISSTVTLNDSIALEAGTYEFSALAMGAEGDRVTLYVLDENGSVIAAGDAAVLTGWSESESDWSEPAMTFTLSEDTTVYLQIGIVFDAYGWGSVDRLCLRAE
ncbi:MAG: glycosyl hydrolase 53 family protein [Clostridiales bacterium]|nr:glycosyl hydrolase 53 family protein [Clostridiales bacterium]